MSEQHDDPTQSYYIAAQESLAELRPRTLKHGDTFALFDRFGDLASGPASAEGLYHEDIRFLSRLRFTIEGHAPLLLSSTVQSNNAMLDVDLVNPDLRRGDVIVLPKDTIHVSRMKFLWNAACYEVLAIRNFDEATRTVPWNSTAISMMSSKCAGSSVIRAAPCTRACLPRTTRDWNIHRWTAYPGRLSCISRRAPPSSRPTARCSRSPSSPSSGARSS
jgi:hypothetical protein